MGLTIINATESSECLSMIEDSLQHIFYEVSNHLGDCNANLKFITKKEMQSLNNQFRGKDACTNVLAFPNDTFAEDQFLGDVAICMEYCDQEAQEQNKPIQHHIMHMLLHALLHLIGYDHQSKDDAAKMEKLEIEMLGKLNIPNPYIVI
jgi:probable rRNA maturation factor